MLDSFARIDNLSIFGVQFKTKTNIMKNTNVYQALNGQVFRTEKEAKEFYGIKFENALKANILFKVIIDADGNEIGEWQ